MARKLETLQKQYSRAVAPSGRGPMAATNNFKGKPKHSRQTVGRILSYIAQFRFRLVPMASIRPPSITMMRSASSTEEVRWAMISFVVSGM